MGENDDTSYQFLPQKPLRLSPSTSNNTIDRSYTWHRRR